jgi:CheY-like chemotaxis protein
MKFDRYPAWTTKFAETPNRIRHFPENESKRGRMEHRGKRILVVDDIQKNSDLLSKFLTGNGYTAASAGDGMEALEKLRSDAFDLIISDVLMSGMDGFELCRAVKRAPKLEAISLIFYTGHYTDAKDEELLRLLGAALYLIKPMTRDQLLENIRQVLERPGGGKIPPWGAERQAHTVKGAASNVGGEALRTVAFAMEKAGKTGDLEAVTAGLPELEAQFGRLKEAMSAFLNHS